MQKLMKKQTGIMLVALIVTVIVLILLAGISLNVTIGENGIITQAQRAKNETAQRQREESGGLASLEQQLDEAIGKTYITEKGVNKPRLATGMKAIKFTNPSESAKGEVQDSNENDIEWYDYNSKKWA
ncbi:MAG: hypothetical protein ACLS95_03920, partial [Clostridia bacterium]